MLSLLMLQEENPSREAVLSAGLSNGSGLLCSIPETAEEQPKKAEQLSEEAQTPGNLDTPVQIQGTSADAEDTTACIPSDATETDSAEEDAEPPVQVGAPGKMRAPILWEHMLLKVCEKLVLCSQS